MRDLFCALGTVKLRVRVKVTFAMQIYAIFLPSNFRVFVRTEFLSIDFLRDFGLLFDRFEVFCPICSAM